MAEAIQKLIAENRWQPIEEAPRDGEYILLLCTHGQYVARWAVEEGEYAWWEVEDNKHGPYPLRGDSPTHFRALPDDRLADVAQALLDTINDALSVADRTMSIAVLRSGRQRANEIATKGE